MTVKKKREYLKNRAEHIDVLRNELAPGDPVWILSSRGMRVRGSSSQLTRLTLLLAL